MKLYASLKQLLLYQMGYLLFNELNNAKDKEQQLQIIERIKTLQTALDQLKQSFSCISSSSPSTSLSPSSSVTPSSETVSAPLPSVPINHFQEVIEHFEFDVDISELSHEPLSDANDSYLHPFGFGMWLQEQSFIDLHWTGTMDDSQTTKQLWRQLTGAYFIKQWKKSHITPNNIVLNARNNTPYLDISLSNHAAVKASQFWASLHTNRIFELSIAEEQRHAVSNIVTSAPPVYEEYADSGRQSRKSIDLCAGTSHDHANMNATLNDAVHSKSAAGGINLFNCVMNGDVLRIACVMLWPPQLAYNVLQEFLTDAALNIDGKHKNIHLDDDIKDSSGGLDSEEATPGSIGRLLLFSNSPLQQQQSIPSIASSPAPPSVTSMGRFSNISTNTSYTGHHNMQCDMDFDQIYQYLMEMDYADKKNPVRYDWKLMVDALNAFQVKVVSIDDYTDNDILQMVQRVQEGLVNSIHDQRSGLIKVACQLFVLIAQYRTPLFLDETFFKFWMICLLRKCANRDKIRTLPAHNACSDIVTCILTYYENNKDHSKPFLLHKVKEIFVIFCSLWTPHELDPLWMKQPKSVTQFIKNISLMIQHTAILREAPPNKIDASLVNEANTDGTTPVENEDIKQMQLIAFDLFKMFQEQSHKEARECGVELLIHLYALEKEKTFEFAKQFFSKRELVDYLKKLQSQDILSTQHKEHLDCVNSKKTRKSIKKKKVKKGETRRRSSVRSEIQKLKQKHKQVTSLSGEVIPEDNEVSSVAQIPE